MTPEEHDKIDKLIQNFNDSVKETQLQMAQGFFSDQEYLIKLINAAMPMIDQLGQSYHRIIGE